MNLMVPKESINTSNSGSPDFSPSGSTEPSCESGECGTCHSSSSPVLAKECKPTDCRIGFPDMATALQVEQSSNLWWNEGDVLCRTISCDLGTPPLVLTAIRSLSMISVEPVDNGVPALYMHESLKGTPPLSNGKVPMVTWQLCVGKRVAQSRYAIFETEAAKAGFAELCKLDGAELVRRLKLIICPRNFPIPLPLRGPKSAVSISEYFGIEAVEARVEDGCRLHVKVDLYAKWIVKQLLKALSVIRNRSVDLFLVTMEPSCVVCSLSLTSTDDSIKALG